MTAVCDSCRSRTRVVRVRWSPPASGNGAPGTVVRAVSARAAWRAYAGHYRYPGAHPYDQSLRIQLVNGALVADDGTPLTPLGGAVFRLGDAWSPERLQFDSVIGGVAQRLRLERRSALPRNDTVRTAGPASGNPNRTR